MLYVLLLIYFLFFSEGYGRIAEEERIYRYNLKPFVEIRRFWMYREQVGLSAFFYEYFRECDRIHSPGIYSAGHQPEMPQRIPDRSVRVQSESVCGNDSACNKSGLL